MKNKTAIGLIGLGNMGMGIAQKVNEQARCIAYDKNRSVRGHASNRGIQVVENLDGLESCGIVVLSLPRPDISLQVLHELSNVLSEGAIILETSTVNPSDMRIFGDMCSEYGFRCLDVAIHAGVDAMRDGTARLLIGGDQPTIRVAQFALDAVSQRQTIVGALGSGMAAKVINNAVAHAVMVVLAEATAMAATEDISIPQLVDLLGGPEGGVTRPLTHRIGERLLQQDFSGGMSTTSARKDSELALQLALQSKTPLFAIQASHTVYELAVSCGLGAVDYASIATLWPQLGEKLANDVETRK